MGKTSSRWGKVRTYVRGASSFLSLLRKVRRNKRRIQGKLPFKTVKKARTTSSKSVKLHAPALQIGTGGSFSVKKWGRRKCKIPKRVVKGLAKNMQVFTNSFRVAAPTGVQSVNGITFYSSDVINTLFTAFQQKSSYNAQKLIMLGMNAEIDFTNQNSNNMRFAIYDIVARRDSSQVNVLDPTKAWKQGLVDMGGGANDYLSVGALPTASPIFTQFWKITKVTHGILSAGQSHAHKVSFQPNKLLEKEIILQLGTGTATVMKGMTVGCVIVAYGMPVNDQTTPTLVSTGSVAYDLTARVQYNCSYMAESVDQWALAASGFGVVTTEEVMLYGSSTKGVDAPA